MIRKAYRRMLHNHHYNRKCSYCFTEYNSLKLRQSGNQKLRPSQKVRRFSRTGSQQFGKVNADIVKTCIQKIELYISQKANSY